MSMKVYPFGSVEVAVAASDIVSIFSKSPVKVYQLNAGLPNMPPTKVLFATAAADADYQSGAFAAAARLVIEAGPSEAFVNIGTAAVPIERRGLRGQGNPGVLDATGTLTAAMIASGIVTSTTAAAVTATLDTGAVMDGALQMEIGESFDWAAINTGGAAFTACDVFDDALPEYDGLHEGVAGEAICPVDAGAGRLAAGEEARERCAAADIGAHPSHEVVGGRCDGDGLCTHIDADTAAEGMDPGETGGEVDRFQARAVEELAVGVFSAHFGDDGACDDIAGSELAERVVAGHEGLARVVTEDGPFAADGLGDEESRCALEAEGGWVELVELDVGDFGAGIEGQGDAVSGGHLGIRGMREQLAGAAGAEHHSGGFVVLRGAGLEGDGLDAGHAAALDCQGSDEGVIEDRDLRVADGGAQGGLDGGAGAVAAGVEDARVAVSGFPPECDFAAEGVEGDTVVDEVPDPGRRFFAEHPGGFFVDQAVTGRDGVGEVLGGGIERADGGGDAALGPAGVAVIDAALGEDEDGPELACFESDEEAGDAAADDDQGVAASRRCGDFARVGSGHES